MDFRVIKGHRASRAGREFKVGKVTKGHRDFKALDFRASRAGRGSREPRVGRD